MAIDRSHSSAVTASAEAPSEVPARTMEQTNSDRSVEAALLLHHVFFWLKNPGSQADRLQLVAGLTTLRDIPVIKQLHIGIPAETEKRDVVDHTYDVSELMVFDTLADQASYQEHPIHREFIRKCGDLWDRVVVYDTKKVE